jgi:hypothetical protein
LLLLILFLLPQIVLMQDLQMVGAAKPFSLHQRVRVAHRLC